MVLSFLTESIALQLCGAFIIIILAYIKYSYNYWKNKGLFYVTPEFQDLFFLNTPVRWRLKRCYTIIKEKRQSHGGMYIGTKPVYVPIDLEIVRNILSKDFQVFPSRGLYYNEEIDPLSVHLFSLEGKRWKTLRAKLTPTFTSGKMKAMFQTVLDCGDVMIKSMAVQCDRKQSFNIKDIMMKYTMDVIGSCAFGIDCNSFKETRSDFLKYGQKIAKPSKLRTIIGNLMTLFPNKYFQMGIRKVSQDISDFYIAIVKNTLQYREKNNIKRNDFMQLLMDLKNNESSEFGKLTTSELYAQTMLFFFAGFETSSTTLTFCLMEISRSQEIQDRLRNEINYVLEKNNGKISYETISEMKYLDQVAHEALRLYSPALMLRRKCVEDYKIPNYDITLEKGTLVLISILGIHHDPDYYEDPENFDPDRFSDEIKSKRHPYAFLGFGEGPKNCIGLRFGLMQVKIGLLLILKNFKLFLNQRTKYPLEYDKSSLTLSSVHPIFIDSEKLNNTDQ